MSNDPMVTESGKWEEEGSSPSCGRTKATGMPALVHSGWDSSVLGLEGKYILCPWPVGGGDVQL